MDHGEGVSSLAALPAPALGDGDATAIPAVLIGSGAYERHVRRVRRRNGQRRAALLAALRAHLGDAVKVVGANAGLHVVVWLNDVSSAQEGAVIARAYEAGLGLYPVTPTSVSDARTDRPGSAGSDCDV